MLVGGNGFVALYERVEDKKDRYVETKRLALGALRLQYAAVFSSEVIPCVSGCGCVSGCASVYECVSMWVWMSECV